MTSKHYLLFILVLKFGVCVCVCTINILNCPLQEIGAIFPCGSEQLQQRTMQSLPFKLPINMKAYNMQFVCFSQDAVGQLCYFSLGKRGTLFLVRFQLNK